LLGDTVIIEAPTVPKALQERGITPQLLTQKLQARLQEIQDVAKVRRESKIPTPAQEPMTVQSAGIHFSLSSLVLAIERILGLESRRRLTMNFVCETDDCALGDFSLHVIALGDRVVAADAVRFPSEDFGSAAEVMVSATEVAANHLLGTYDPYVIGIYNVRQRKIDEARVIANRVISQESENEIWGHNLRGIVELESGNLLVAERYFRRALEIDSEFIEAIVNTGVVHFRLNNFDKAKRYYLQALSLDRELAVVHSNLGKTLYITCEWAAATAAFEQTLAIDRGDPTDYWALESLKLLRSGGPEALKELYDRVSGADPDRAIAVPMINTFVKIASDCSGPLEKLWRKVPPANSDLWAAHTDHP
jgi:tetratricopeptide (TPR) repeat protein